MNTCQSQLSISYHFPLKCICDVQSQQQRYFPNSAPDLAAGPCPHTASQRPQQPFRQALDGCTYRCDNLTSDLHKTRFLTQRADSFKGILLLPLHKRNLPQKDVSVWEGCGFRRRFQGLSSRGRDSARQLCEHGKELEGKYEEKMNLFSTKHVYFNFSEASKKSWSKTPGYKSK